MFATKSNKELHLYHHMFLKRCFLRVMTPDLRVMTPDLCSLQSSN